MTDTIKPRKIEYVNQGERYEAENAKMQDAFEEWGREMGELDADNPWVPRGDDAFITLHMFNLRFMGDLGWPGLADTIPLPYFTHWALKVGNCLFEGIEQTTPLREGQHAKPIVVHAEYCPETKCQGLQRNFETKYPIAERHTGAKIEEIVQILIRYTAERPYYQLCPEYYHEYHEGRDEGRGEMNCQDIVFALASKLMGWTNGNSVPTDFPNRQSLATMPLQIITRPLQFALKPTDKDKKFQKAMKKAQARPFLHILFHDEAYLKKLLVETYGRLHKMVCTSPAYARPIEAQEDRPSLSLTRKLSAPAEPAQQEKTANSVHEHTDV